MKTIKAFGYLLAAGALVASSACSSTSTGTSDTAGSGGSTAPGTYSSMGSTAAGTNSTGMGTAAPGAAGSTDASGSTSGTTSGTASGSMGGATGGASTSGSAAGMGSSGAGGATAMSGSDMSADQTTFMGTFATMPDAVFLINAASSSMLEIKAGQLASQKATNPEVRKFGQMMVSHHTAATQELKAVATPLGTKLPQAMMPVHQAMADALMSKTGKDFDEAYMDTMEAAHKMDIAMFEVKSKAAEKVQVQAFATKTLPMLRSHYTLADKLEDEVD